MPPRGTGRGAARGRGRGRGRGVSSRPAPEEGATPSAPADAPATSTSSSVPISGNDTQAAAASSSSEQPAQTTASAAPASATTRSAAQSTPAPTSVATSAASTPASTRTGTAPSTSKFRPKGVRRGEAERERIAQEQLAIQNKRIADEARAKARANRFSGRGRGGRGRGRGGLFDRIKTEAPRTDFNRANFLKSAPGFAPSGNLKSENSKFDEVAMLLSQPDDHRTNADNMYGCAPESDGEEENGLQSTAVKKLLKPMGTLRIEHKVEKVVVTSSKEIEAQDQGDEMEEYEDDSSDDMFVDGGNNGDAATEPINDEGVWAHAVPKTQGKVKVQREDGSIIETMDIDEIVGRKRLTDEEAAALEQNIPPESPDRKKKSVVLDVAATEEPKKTKKRKVFRDPEREREAQQLSWQLGLLRMDSQEVEADGVVETRADTSDRDGNMFLMQFPPVLPPLRAVHREDPVKDEPNDDVVMLDTPVAGGSANIDLTGDENDEEEEGDGAGADKDKASETLKEGGFLGEMIVHKSGKVELSWGGYTFDMRPGIETQFLTTVALLEEHDAKPSAMSEELYTGTAYGMGRIMGKFVLAPRFAPEQEWIVDPKDLEVPEDMQ